MTKKERKNDGSLDLRVDLKGKHADLLEKIMEERKFQYYAEAIRYCIVETYTKSEFKLEEIYHKRIKQFMELDHVRNNLRVYNVESFIYKALDKYLEDIEKSRESLLSFNVRSDLTGDDLEVSQAVIEVQSKSEGSQVTAKQIAEYMGRRNVDAIADILNNFVDRGILNKLVSSGETYYHAF